VTPCELIREEYESLVEEREQNRRDLQEPGLSSRTIRYLLKEIARLSQLIASKRQAYNDCLPDLLAKTFRILPNRAAQTLSVAGVVQNNSAVAVQ
jgi:hypothetical protein